MKTNILLIGSLMMIGLLLLSCSKDDGDTDDAASGDSAIRCPGVDGIYYHAFIPQGACASQGVTLDDRGVLIQNGGIVQSAYANCTSEVQYDACTLNVQMQCAGGMSIDIRQTYEPGSPNVVTGTQTQHMTGAQSCVYEIYGATDLASVLQYAGLPDGTDVSDLSTPKTPDPDNASQAQSDCLARAEAELAVCADDAGDVERMTKSCVDFWSDYDAVGCADAWLAWTNCITDNAADYDCQTGELPACDVFANAYFQCSSAFTAATMCSKAGDPATLCGDDGGTYSYGCLGDEAPFADCTEVPTDGAGVAMYCCF